MYNAMEHLRTIEGCFWTRMEDLLYEFKCDTFEDAFEVLEANREYITVVSNYEEDTEFLVYLGGTESTIIIDKIVQVKL